MNSLRNKLLEIDGKGYGAYKDIKGTYAGEFYTLYIDHIQADPFAPPSRIRVALSIDTIKINHEWINNKHRKIAAEDFFARECGKSIQTFSGESNKTGAIFIDTPGQEMLERTAVKIDQRHIEFRLSVSLPSHGRKILGKSASNLFLRDLSKIINNSVNNFSPEALQEQIYLCVQQQRIREFIKDNNYVAFIANGSILPRKSGTSNLPLIEGTVIPFKSPESLEVEISVPHRRSIKGMGIPKGITLIVGGGYHGKTTLLKAIERGVYNHILGDGREYVITDETAVKVRAEDGRVIEKVNILPFISQLPFGKDTSEFSSLDASGSTSQATNIIEAIEMKSKLILVDEDTSATNFMIRDARMQELIAKDKEPITPFIDKISSLYEEHGVSTILVIGGSGDYLEVAQRVIMMDEYAPSDVTDKAKEIISQLPSNRRVEGGLTFGQISERIILPESFVLDFNKKIKIKGHGTYSIRYDKENIDLTAIEQLIDKSQTNALAYMLQYISRELSKDPRTYTLEELVELVYSTISSSGLDAISPFNGQHPGDLAMPRKYELAASINRFPKLIIK